MQKKVKGSPFLSGFGNDNIIEEFYAGKDRKQTPLAILSENQEVYKIDLGAPYIRKKDLELKFEGRSLIVEGTRNVPDNSTDDVRRYHGVFRVPENVEQNEIQTIEQGGLVSILLQKKPNHLDN